MDAGAARLLADEFQVLGTDTRPSRRMRRPRTTGCPRVVRRQGGDDPVAKTCTGWACLVGLRQRKNIHVVLSMVAMRMALSADHTRTRLRRRLGHVPFSGRSGRGW
jgi:hypothetical protein